MELLPSGLPEQIASTEDLARFLIQSNQFNSIMVKPAAFLPNPKDRETSVSRHGREPIASLWEIGLIAAGNRTLHGAAMFKAQDVKAAQLEITPDEPPPRHAVIRGWPWNDADPVEQKARQLERAAQLASAAGMPLRRVTASNG